jgi:hypothetical protein
MAKKLLKLLPIILVVGFIVISGSTTWASKQVHDQIAKQLHAFEGELLPFALNMSLAFLIVYSAWLFYGSAKTGWVNFLTRVGVAQRGMTFLTMCFQAVFWLFTVSLAFTTLAPTGLLKNVAISGGFVAAIAGVVALGAKDAVANVFYSVCLHTLPKCAEGDYVKVEGVTPAEGVIQKINFLTSTIKRADTGQMVVLTNNLLWQNTVTIGIPPAKPKDKDDAPKVIVYCCHGGSCPGALQAASVPVPPASQSTSQP